MTEKPTVNKCLEDKNCNESEFECSGKCMSNEEFLYQYFAKRGLIEKTLKTRAGREDKTNMLKKP